MSILSKTRITSFTTNVLPLTANTDKAVKWRSDSDILDIRTFSEGELAFDNGVLLTLKKEGKATVYAECDGVEYPCEVEIRQIRHWTNEEACNYYVGDFHDHTTDEHNHDKFAVRETGFPIDVIESVKKDGKMDFHVISDHTKTLNQRDFFRGFTDDEKSEPKGHVVFPGSESEVTVVETDRYGIDCKCSGEIVTFNANNYSYSHSWEEFFSDLKDSPFAMCILAHPQVSGFSVNGIWNFKLDKNNSPRMRELVRAVEMGDGGDRESNLLNEYIYSKALDNGFCASVTCSSDSHGNFGWGYGVFPGKTVIMASERSKEAFLDAIANNRFYASSSGNVKLRFSVNGCLAPCTLSPTDAYDFVADAELFSDIADTVPVKCQVVSDRGRYIKTFEGDVSHLEFTIDSNEASYFYLRYIDSLGRKTWSPPVWTGREPKKYSYPSKPFSKKGWTAVNVLDSSDASEVICDDPSRYWHTDAQKASIVIDMQEERTVSAVGHYARLVERLELSKQGISLSTVMGAMAAEVEIYTSIDGVSFEKRFDGFVRVYGGEEILPFDPIRARYLRFDVLSNVGVASERKEMANFSLDIAELSVY